MSDPEDLPIHSLTLFPPVNQSKSTAYTSSGWRRGFLPNTGANYFPSRKIIEFA